MNIPVAPRQGQKGLQMMALLSLAVTVASALIPDPEQTLGPLRLLLALAAGLALVFWLAPRRLSDSVADQSLDIGKLTGTVSFPYAGMTARVASRGLGLKMGGTGLPEYFSGNYVYGADGLNHVQTAASNTSGGVLVTEGPRTYYPPAQPEAWLHQLKAHGAQVYS
ncbi:hypothetical protein [Deinococcus navajonensis]|uniref:DUF4131 domain-containing protein n=1 Tax=Deinococcus navajonensis TaxID=309884 RepID=A0ABV8XMJ2_9DEIO